MEKTAPTVAIVLFVKNEFSDIKGWIAWHFALGVKTLFVFDDHSTDGTWEVLQAAAKCFDIRLFRTDPLNETNFYWRQKKSFLQAVEECKGEYDWLGFLDGDEYIYIKHFDTLPEFFYRFDHADAVAFSWKIYGHSNKVVRPKLTIVESFVEHSTTNLGDNQLIKTFLRPEKLKGNYHDPHWFYDIDADRYVRPHGGKVKNPGATQEIEWSDAFVMHYICRSMEHFVDRVKKRPDNAGYWKRFACSDIKDTEPLRFVPKMNDNLIMIHKAMLKDAIQKLGSSPYTSQNIVGNNIGYSETPAVYRVKSHFDTFLCYDPSSKLVVHATEESINQNNYKILLGLIYPSLPNIITITLEMQDDDVPYLRTREGVPLYNKLFFRIDALDDGKKGLLTLAGDVYYYTCFMPPNGSCGDLYSDRLICNDNEKVILEYVGEGNDFIDDSLPFNVFDVSSVDTIIEWIANTPNLSEDQFLRVMYALPPSVRDHISKYLIPGLLWPYI
ncbi:Glycosyltransferase involved in cell wall bisynthesis (WcaA) (PDB:5MLZ) [Commensalibacter communis]|uniref:glycosyltransferase family 2 protein n=1 Tax=Commensalibacter communis TaxID=2972786 RepID=UPI0022FFA291|nr:glycosyltransferase family 2 protein [Commensalibacter communis]CAI3925381.1 Glycosyltransferase involved in cell wall bisynthesis (WcaA) (PDB:5MLZ) [Commensalibacter communis]CAI3933958.1 Glycosyltransferase involved in cell wall bisynthesis (WcaA) (PDB:5MLZ) [Commensalibacter communis]